MNGKRRKWDGFSCVAKDSGAGLNFPFHFKANQLDFMFEMMRTEFPRARVRSPPHGKRLLPGNSKCDDQRVKHNIRLYKLPFFEEYKIHVTPLH